MSFSYNIVDSVTSFHWLFFRLALGKQFAGEKQSPQYGQDNVASWTKAPVAVTLPTTKTKIILLRLDKRSDESARTNQTVSKKIFYLAIACSAILISLQTFWSTFLFLAQTHTHTLHRTGHRFISIYEARPLWPRCKYRSSHTEK